MQNKPPEELQQLVGAINDNRRLCHELTESFNSSQPSWQNPASPEGIRTWIDRTAPSAAQETRRATTR